MITQWKLLKGEKVYFWSVSEGQSPSRSAVAEGGDWLITLWPHTGCKRTGSETGLWNHKARSHYPLLARLRFLKGSQPPQNNTINWKARVQAHKSAGDISHLEHKYGPRWGRGDGDCVGGDSGTDLSLVSQELTCLSLGGLCVSPVCDNLRQQEQSCHMPADCQFDRVWNQLEDAPLERAVRPLARSTAYFSRGLRKRGCWCRHSSLHTCECFFPIAALTPTILQRPSNAYWRAASLQESSSSSATGFMASNLVDRAACVLFLSSVQTVVGWAHAM